MIFNKEELKEFLKVSHNVGSMPDQGYDSNGNYSDTEIFEYTDGNTYAVFYYNGHPEPEWNIETKKHDIYHVQKVKPVETVVTYWEVIDE